MRAALGDFSGGKRRRQSPGHPRQRPYARRLRDRHTAHARCGYCLLARIRRVYTLDDFAKLSRPAARYRELDLVDSVAPVQLAIRLLVPNGSVSSRRPRLKANSKPTTRLRWATPGIMTTPVDSLQQTVWAIAEKADSEDAPRSATFKQIWQARRSG